MFHKCNFNSYPPFIINKHVGLVEVALTCLQIPLVQKNTIIEYINSKLSHMCTKIITKLRVLGFHPLDVYNNWLTYFDNMNFIQSLTKFEYEKL
jgi:hypothetical protein